MVWALCHQLRFFYRKLADGDRILAWCFLWGGLFSLVGLVLTNIYPPSMAGLADGVVVGDPQRWGGRRGVGLTQGAGDPERPGVRQGGFGGGP